LVCAFSACNTITDELAEIQADNPELSLQNFEADTEGNITDQRKQISYSLDAAAKVVAILMESEEVRILLKEKAQLRFDGDYDVLYSSIKNIELKNGMTIEEHLLKINPKFAKIAASIPKFNISVPVECDEWNTENYVPSVAVMPFGLQEGTFKTITTYTSKGEVEYLSAMEDPKVPVVVVGICERVDENEKLRVEFQPKLKDEKPSLMRVEGHQEKVQKIKCPNLGQIEAWTSGAPELILQVYGYYVVSNQPNSNPSTLGTGKIISYQFFEPNKRKDINNQYWTTNRNIVRWYINPAVSFNVFSTAFEYRWVEEDYVPAANKDINITFSVPVKVQVGPATVTVTPTLNLKWTTGQDDDYCGFSLVQYQSPTPSTHSTGLVEWVQTSSAQ
jgi:hypothetical protein